MITRLGVAGIFVLDYEESKRFFVDRLGFEERMDVTMENGFRWLTVGPRDDPRFQLVLSKPGPPVHGEQDAATIRTLVTKGAFSGGAWNTDDCRATYAEYAARGVEFLREPRERPYGVEAVFRDNSGNWYSLNETYEAAFDSAEMARHFDPGSTP